MESKDQTDCNISGISNLSDSFEDADELFETSSPEESVPDVKSESMKACTVSPPWKKFRTLSSGESLTQGSVTERSQSSSIESEPSQSFHFTQWRKDQIAKCKAIHDETSFEDSPCTDGVTSSGIEPDLTFNHRNEVTEFSETPPFQFTQWANKQVEICRKIQKQANDIPSKERHETYSQDRELKLGSREGSADSESQSFYSGWSKIPVSTSRNLRDEIQEETGSSASEVWESETWDYWTGNKRDTAPFTQSLQSDETEFQFSDWVKSQMRKCRVIREESEERN